MKSLDIALMAAAGNVTATNPNAWDLSKFQPASNPSSAWDISTAEFGTNHTGSFSTYPRGMVFKPDGTKLYVTGSYSDNVKEYSLPHPWSTLDSSLDYTLSVSAQEAQASALFFKPDGTKFFLIGFNSDSIHEYDLSTAWDLSTASFNNNEFSVSSQEINPEGLFFKTDGTKMYVVGTTGDDVNEYDLSTAWDVTSATYSQNFSVSGQDTAPRGVHFKSDGTKMYIVGDAGNDINEYDLSTAWDVSTASYNQNFSVSGREGSPTCMWFKPDGTKMYVMGISGDDINEYILDPYFFDVSSQQSDPRGVFFKPDGTKMYIVGASGPDRVHEYNLSTAWDHTTASYSSNYFSVNSQDTNPNGMFWKSDGTQFWVVGTSTNTIYQYGCSTAWDLSTASYANKSLTVTEISLQDVFLTPDGTRAYYVGISTDLLTQVDLSTAWDISTGTVDASLNVNTNGGLGNPSGLFFKPDGTKLYVCGYGDIANEKLVEYDLSTEWDVSTASISHTLSTGISLTRTREVYFKPDGTSFFLTGSERDHVARFDVI